MFSEEKEEPCIGFFDQIVSEVFQHEDDGPLDEVFKPVLDKCAHKFMKEFTLMTPGILRELDLVNVFSRHEALAKVSSYKYNSRLCGFQ